MPVPKSGLSGQSLKDAIMQETWQSVSKRDAYIASVRRELIESLKTCRDDVGSAILQYKSFGSLPENKLAARNGLKRLQQEIDEITSALKRRNSTVFTKATRTSFRQGIYHGIEEFVAAKVPGYAEMAGGQINKMATSVFTVIDRSALDFMANYNLQLSGDVSQELRNKLRQAVTTGIINGLGTDDIVQSLGDIVTDKAAFRRAGGRVYRSAQQRLETIVHTEMIRAHNQGQLKFYGSVGVEEVEWLAMMDERTCPVCGTLHGKRFPLSKFPAIPAHPNCGCTTIAVLDDDGVVNPDAEKPKVVRAPDVVNTKADVVRTSKNAWNSPTEDAIENLDEKYLKYIAKNLMSLEDLENGLKNSDQEIRYTPKATKNNIVSDILDSGEAAVKSVIKNAMTWRKWARCKTALQLEDMAKRTWIGKDFCFRGSDVIAIGPAMREFDLISRRYPQIIKDVKYVGNYADRPYLIPSSWASPRGAYAHVINPEDDGFMIGLNAKYWNNGGFFLKRLRLASRSLLHPRGCNTPEYVMSHEVGHVFHLWIMNAERKDSTLFGEIYPDNFGTLHKTCETIVRMEYDQNRFCTYPDDVYARHNGTNDEKQLKRDKEVFAEAFSASRHQPKRHNDKIVLTIREFASIIGDGSGLVDKSESTVVQSSSKLMRLK